MRTNPAIFVLISIAMFIGWAMPVLGAGVPGDIRYQRQEGAGSEQAFPPAVFQHWLHRIRYRCDACHDSLFEMKQGATVVTMASIAEGKAWRMPQRHTCI